ncbi:MAG TPA: hypothetical protein VFS12_16110 [Terriglobia bacterium]|nr:hypothetical protein [Terriglobia bacterium]
MMNHDTPIENNKPGVGNSGSGTTLLTQSQHRKSVTASKLLNPLCYTGRHFQAGCLMMGENSMKE